MINLLDYPDETLARWSCTLNSWKYPDDMPEKPEDWESLPLLYELDNGCVDRSKRSKFTVIQVLRGAIEKEIGEKEVMRWHHIHNLKRTNEKFEAWWSKQDFD